jgi:hypothetical protein
VTTNQEWNRSLRPGGADSAHLDQMVRPELFTQNFAFKFRRFELNATGYEILRRPEAGGSEAELFDSIFRD